ncbi:MAG: hypothetical protein GX455_09065 [Phycisphaerae bacterium]|nr:hypothetical protein [Phycisphaerae bacterium]
MTAAIVALLWLNGQRRLQRKIEALHAKGFPITFEEIEQKRRLPPGTPNAADLYQQAFDAYQQPSAQDMPLLPYVGSAKLPEPGVPLSEEMVAAISRFVEANRQTLTLLKQGVTIPDCAFAPKNLKPFPFPPYSSSFKVYGYLWELESVLCIERKDYEGTLNNIQDNIRYGDSLKRYPYFVDYLNYSGVHLRNIRIMERILNSQQVEERILDEMNRCLDYPLSPQIVEDALRDELPSLLEIQSDPSSWTGSNSLFSNKAAQSNIVECLDIIEELITAHSYGHPERFRRIQVVRKKINGMTSFFHPVSTMEIPSLTLTCRMNLQIEAGFDSVRISIAIERFRLETGKLPERLEELTPKYMEKVPIDPFDGQPLRFKRLEKGYVIYSIGEDGKDDGGKMKKYGEENFDYPFTVHR